MNAPDQIAAKTISRRDFVRKIHLCRQSRTRDVAVIAPGGAVTSAPAQVGLFSLE
jgi:hypothetical protein